MLTEVHEREALMRVREVADELGQHPATIYRKITAGEIPSVRLGSGRAAIRVPRAEFEQGLHGSNSQSGSGAAAPPPSSQGGLEGEAA
jgi:excisionase family DNA binding protein